MGAAQPRALAPGIRLARPAKLAWLANRLRCMSPAEVAHRVARVPVAWLERAGALPLHVPAPDLAQAGTPWIDTGASVDVDTYRLAADRILDGVHDVFALRGVQLGNPPQWNVEPKSGVVAPPTFGKHLDYRDPAVVGDCKYLWEPNRHLHLVTLAQAWALTREERYAQAVRTHLDSWFQACPFRMGAQWASALEPAMRLLNWSLAWPLLGGVQSPLFAGTDGAAFRDRWLRAVYEHAEFVAGHFSLHSSANNHLLGEAAGVYVAGAAWPHWPRAARWRAIGRRILEREVLLQVAPDGVNREQATSYLQYAFDLLLLPWLAARARGEPFSDGYGRRLEGMLGFLAAIMDAGGNVPMIGDADDAFAVRLDPRENFCRYRSLLATGAVLFGRADFHRKAGALDDKTRWLLGADGARAFATLDGTPTPPARRDFPEGGYYILGDAFDTPAEVRIVADAGPLGYREIAAHGHADALAFTLSLGGVPMLVDPGTYAYHTNEAWRAYFRGTAAHNTVRIDGRDQSQQGGNFLWLRKARATCLAWQPGDREDRFEGEHDGYAALEDPVRHRRALVFDKATRRLLVEDRLEAAGEHRVEIFFHAPPQAQVRPVEGGFEILRAGRALRLRMPEHPGAESRVLVGTTDPIAGWHSPGYDVKVPAPTIRWSARVRGNARLATTVDCTLQ